MYTQENFGFIIWQNEWNLVCSEGLFFKDENGKWEKIGDDSIIDEDDFDRCPMASAAALYFYACNMAKINALDLDVILEKAVHAMDLNGFAYVRLMKVLMEATMDHVDDLIGFRYPVRIRCELKEEMSPEEWKCAMQEMVNCLNALAHAVGCSVQGFLDNPKYKLDVEKFKK